MSVNRKNYLRSLKQFWEVNDFTELKFNRVDTLYGEDRTDQRFDELLDERVSWLVSDLDLPHKPKIVEIGCGIGAVVERFLFKYEDAEIWGFDISEAMISEAQKLVGNNPRCHLKLTDGDNLSEIPSESVDLVICSGVFIHILEIEVIQNYIREVYRILKPNGQFRFNVRYRNPYISFSDSLGGNLAKFLFRIGYYSPMKSFNSLSDKNRGFEGLLFSLDDIDTLTRKCGLIPEKFIVLSKEKRLASGYIRVNSHKC
jgi:ubiquinone/menaquinone biosynthesis C-methylase UbiE